MTALKVRASLPVHKLYAVSEPLAAYFVLCPGGTNGWSQPIHSESVGSFNALSPSDVSGYSGAHADAGCYSSSGLAFRRASSNLAFIVGFPRVSRLMVSPSALSLARRRFRSEPISASLIFCK